MSLRINFKDLFRKIVNSIISLIKRSYDKIKNLILRLISLLKSNNYIKLVVLLIVLISIYVYVNIASTSINQFILSLFYDKTISIVNLFSPIFFFGLGFFVLFSLIKVLIDIVCDLLKIDKVNINNYFILSLTSMIILIVGAIMMIHEIYKPDFPLEINIKDDVYVKTDTILCFTQDRDLRLKIVEGDFIYCKFEFRHDLYPNVTRLYLYSDIEIYLPYQSNKSSENRIYMITNTTKFVDFTSIKIEVAEKTDLRLEIKLFNEQGEEISLFGIITFRPMTMQQYLEWNQDKYSFLFLLITLSIFSVLSGVYHLKKIMENGKENEKR